MRLGMRKEIDWAYIGAMMANADSNEQVEFFRAFVKECGKWGTHFQVESQLACINMNLSKEEREVLRMLGYSE
jgi:hypothetical protein